MDGEAEVLCIVHAIKRNETESYREAPIHFTVDLLHTNKSDREQVPFFFPSPPLPNSHGGLSQDGIYTSLRVQFRSIYINIFMYSILYEAWNSG